MIDLGGTLKEVKANYAQGIGHPVILAEVERELDSIQGELDDDLETLEAFGGNFYLVESEADLKQIKVPGSRFNPDTRAIELYMNSIAYTAVAGDACEYIGDNREFILFFLATNNAGGPTYFIPKEVYELNPNVVRSVEETSKFWSMG